WRGAIPPGRRPRGRGDTSHVRQKDPDRDAAGVVDGPADCRGYVRPGCPPGGATPATRKGRTAFGEGKGPGAEGGNRGHATAGPARAVTHAAVQRPGGERGRHLPRGVGDAEGAEGGHRRPGEEGSIAGGDRRPAGGPGGETGDGRCAAGAR